MFTETGYMDKVGWQTIIKHVAENWNAVHPGLELLLFVDQLESHMQANVVTAANNRSIRFVFYPAELTHVLQVLDGHPFALFKKFLGQVKAELDFSASIRAVRARGNVVDAAFDAEDRAFTQSVIVKEFAARGTWPFDAARVVHRLVQAAVGGARRAPSRDSDAVASVAVAAAAAVIDAARPRRRVVKRANVKHNKVYNDRQLLDLARLTEQAHADKKADAERRERARAERVAARSATAAARHAAAVQRRAEDKRRLREKVDAEVRRAARDDVAAPPRFVLANALAGASRAGGKTCGQHVPTLPEGHPRPHVRWLCAVRRLLGAPPMRSRCDVREPTRSDVRWRCVETCEIKRRIVSVNGAFRVVSLAENERETCAVGCHGWVQNRAFWVQFWAATQCCVIPRHRP